MTDDAEAEVARNFGRYWETKPGVPFRKATVCLNPNPAPPLSNNPGTIAHELGHALGLNHVSGGTLQSPPFDPCPDTQYDSIMSYNYVAWQAQWPADQKPTQEDVRGPWVCGLGNAAGLAYIYQVPPSYGVPPDTDGDGVLNALDNCRPVYNPSQANFDADGPPFGNGPGIGNGKGTAGDDTTTPNGDGSGDACDSDDDNDGLIDGGDSNPRGDITYDDDNDGTPGIGCLGSVGTDPSDDGVSWDDNCDGRRDSLTPAYCSGLPIVDYDLDGVPERHETCKWGSSDADQDTDGDGIIDCVEIADVSGDGAKSFLSDLLPYAHAVQDPPAAFGKDGDFDYDGSNNLTFLTDLLPVAKLIQLTNPASGGCPFLPGPPNP